MAIGPWHSASAQFVQSFCLSNLEETPHGACCLKATGMEALRGLGEWLPFPGRPAAQQPERQRLSTASLGREIDIPLRGVVRRGAAGEPDAGDEDLVNMAKGVQERRLVRLTRGYALSIEEHGRRGIVNTHERFIGLIGRVVKIDRDSASCDGKSEACCAPLCRRERVSNNPILLKI